MPLLTDTGDSIRFTSSSTSHAGVDSAATGGEDCRGGPGIGERSGADNRCGAGERDGPGDPGVAEDHLDGPSNGFARCSAAEAEANLEAADVDLDVALGASMSVATSACAEDSRVNSFLEVSRVPSRGVSLGV